MRGNGCKLALTTEAAFHVAIALVRSAVSAELCLNKTRR